MIVSILATLARAQDPVLATYDCTQENPMQYADFHLVFRAAVSMDPERPVQATVWDLETGTIRSRDLRVRHAFEIPGFDASSMGRDENRTIYVLRVPDDGDLSGQFDAQVLQVFGDGVAQWVNNFVCIEQ